MDDQLFDTAAQVIATASRDHPADAVLRQILGGPPRLAPGRSRAVTQLVFAYYRWRGWLDAQHPMPRQLEHALDLADQYARGEKSVHDAALRQMAVPGWISRQVAVTVPWLRTLQHEPRLWLRAKPGQGKDVMAGLGGPRSVMPGPLPDSMAYSGSQDLFQSPAFHRGDFEIQDIASQAVSLICSPQPGEKWWDACAGEGGKTLHLAALMKNQGLIWASDRADWRLARLKRRAGRAGVFNYRAAHWEGGPHLPTKTQFDGVLLDAPCSGVGTWQRNPHARWTLTPADVEELAAIQSRLLALAASAVKPGGRLVYSVCTLTRAETEMVTRQFAEVHPQFVSLATPNPFHPSHLPQPCHWLWPQDTRGNGMYITCWQRKA